jgi:hypothetical protein
VELKYSVDSKKDKIVISRGNLEFHFINKGQYSEELRIFGFNPEPFRGDNTDFGLFMYGYPLLTTHLFIVNNAAIVAKEFETTKCEKVSFDTATIVPVIVASSRVNHLVSRLVKKRRKNKRICAKITGVKMSYYSRFIDGNLPLRECETDCVKEDKIDYKNPLLLDNIEEVEC